MNAYRRVDVSTADDIALVRFVDRKIIDTASIEELGDELNSVVEKDKHNNVVLNFNSVEFLSSAALNKLIVLDRLVKSRKGKLKLCNMRKEIHDLLVMTRLTILFDVKPTESDAITAIKAS